MNKMKYELQATKNVIEKYTNFVSRYSSKNKNI